MAMTAQQRRDAAEAMRLCRSIIKRKSADAVVTQSAPARTVAGAMGAASAYDSAASDDERVRIAQAVHDAARSLGATCAAAGVKSKALRAGRRPTPPPLDVRLRGAALLRKFRLMQAINANEAAIAGLRSATVYDSSPWRSGAAPDPFIRPDWFRGW